MVLIVSAKPVKIPRPLLMAVPPPSFLNVYARQVTEYQGCTLHSLYCLALPYNFTQKQVAVATLL